MLNVRATCSSIYLSATMNSPTTPTLPELYIDHLISHHISVSSRSTSIGTSAETSSFSTLPPPLLNLTFSLTLLANGGLDFWSAGHPGRGYTVNNSDRCKSWWDSHNPHIDNQGIPPAQIVVLEHQPRSDTKLQSPVCHRCPFRYGSI